MSHTLDDDFEHFLCYQNWNDLSRPMKRLLKIAYEHGSRLERVEQEAVAYVSESDLERLADPRIAGKGCFLNKEPREGFVAIYVAPPRNNEQTAQEDRLSLQDVFIELREDFNLKDSGKALKAVERAIAKGASK